MIFRISVPYGSLTKLAILLIPLLVYLFIYLVALVQRPLGFPSWEISMINC